MTIKEIYDELDSFTDAERNKHVIAICKLLSRVSMKTLMRFHQNWDGTKGFAEFFKAQTQEIRLCLDLEMGDSGKTVRKLEGLTKLTWETEVGILDPTSH